jgi:RNA recognition motif-containing protein
MDFFLSHLPPDTSEHYLKRFFKPFGEIKSITLVPNEPENYSQLLAIVTVEVKKEYEKHVALLEKVKS